LTEVYRKAGIELRLGPYQDVLADVEACDAVVGDPPYSSRTHDGHDDGASLDRGGYAPRSDGGADRRRARRELSYAHWSEEDVEECVAFWGARNRGWFALMSDSELTREYRAAYERGGLTGFQPLPCVIPGMTVRLAGDGPSSWAVYLNVARPKALSKWGTLRGFFGPIGQGERFAIGGKPIELMRQVIREYSRPGNLIVDPCAGGATTLIAAALEGRRAIGAELDPKTFELACKRIAGMAITPPLFVDERPTPKQEGLF
jgi:site-specific DNA-methyltransferase (adenine-specific)